MQSFVLQDWITVRGSGTAVFIQEAKSWLGFSSFQDIVFHLDIRRINLSVPVSGLAWNFQTSPTKDESLFTTMVTTGGAVNAVTVVPVLLASSPVPLATWVRWSLTPGANTFWDTTFRVMVSANRLAQGLA